jgi:hypothetical protein
MSWQVLGIRHHGPGCARSVVAALEALQPDIIALEGPADGEPALGQLGHADLKPPVAMLLYPVDEPKRGVYYPLAEFSPEWQTLQWARTNRVPVKLMDLPQSVQFGDEKEEAEKHVDDKEPAWRGDPIAVLAEAAGFVDHELWWEQQIERRVDATGLFQGILEAMTAVRTEYPQTSPRDQRREAHMRQTLRGIRQSLTPRVAVVCGAYHAPVLTHDALDRYSVKDDASLLKGLPKSKVTATWIPWSYSRLSYRSGYGAGMDSPGWYHHLWQHREAAPTHFLTRAARLLRANDLDASSASVIETKRLADALASLRDLRAPGLAELNEAMLSVLCHGQQGPLTLIHDRLEVGDVIGEVPDDVASVPLARDLEIQTRQLRLKRTSEAKELDLDLRKPTDLSRSILFHRLNLLDLSWATLQPQKMQTSTFHEYWQVVWNPELAVAVIDASVWGNTVEQAARARCEHRAKDLREVGALAGLLQQALLAQLLDALPAILDQLRNQAGLAADVLQLMEGIPSLAKLIRYSDVRQTQAQAVTPILEGLVTRAIVGLPGACASLDDDAAAAVVERIDGVSEALQTLQRSDLLAEWFAMLTKLLHSTAHGLVRGRCCRLLLDHSVLASDRFSQQTRQALSTALPPATVAAWIQGLLRGSGMVLLHQDDLWQSMDRWLAELSDMHFIEMLPLLRRAFADFTTPERQAMGQKVKHLSAVMVASPEAEPESSLDLERARRVLPILRTILGP